MAEQKILNVRVDERIMAALAEKANDLDITVSELVRSFLDEGLSIKRAKPNPRNPNPEGMIVLPTTRLELYRLYDYWNANHPIVANAIDYFASKGRDFRIGGGNVETLVRLEKLHRLLDDKAEAIMRELALKGDAFVMASLDCPKCDAMDPHCSHENASIKDVSILDPSEIEVHFNLNAGGGTFLEELYLLPTRELKNLVKNRKPDSGLPQSLIDAIENDKPVKLDPSYATHIKVGNSDYERYGSSILKGLLYDLMKEDKDRQKGRDFQRVSINPEILHQRIAAAREQLKKVLDKILILQTTLWGEPSVSVSWPEDYSRRCPLCTDDNLRGEAEDVFWVTEGKIHAVKEALDGLGALVTYEQIDQHFRHHDKKGRWERNSV